ncbi:MAG: PTS mannitol transporter subunit IICB [Sphaerochaetaceae bacterium]|jgi:PTS system mannitol-specific IIC component
MKKGVQKVGRFLSGMVMPNIGAFIAWGLIAAFFISTGWTPNERLGSMVGPMLTYLLPLLIGYTGGKMVSGGIRGGVVGAIATMGVILGADITMFMGAMIAGPLGGWVIKKVDRALEGHIKEGFEMLVNNFSAGIVGALLAILCFLGIAPLVAGLNAILSAGVGWLVKHNLLPLTSILVEPGKVLFLNNAINHGIFTPLGAQQAAETGKSIFFMIESNPGPGLGLLLAYSLVGKGEAKNSAPGAIIIHFLGGIHEIYFPYVLMNPILIVAMIGGGFMGVLTLSILGGGLIAAASPGSIFAELIMTPHGAYFANIMGILVGAVATFLLSVVLLKAFGKEEASLETAKAEVKAMKRESKGEPTTGTVHGGPVQKIVFACDAGMGSSAMGATRLKKKLLNAGITNVAVLHASVNEIPDDADVIVVHHELRERAAEKNRHAKFVVITDFLNAPEYDRIVEDLRSGFSEEQ